MNGFPCTMQCEKCRRIMSFSEPPLVCVCGATFQLPKQTKPLQDWYRDTKARTTRRRVEHFRLAGDKSGAFFSHAYQGEPGSFISIGAQDGARITSLTVGNLMIVRPKEGEEVPLDALRGVAFGIEYAAGEPIVVQALEPIHITLVLEEYTWS